MKPVTLRKSLIHHQETLSNSILKDADVSMLCDRSLECYFEECMKRSLYTEALSAGLILDKIKLPRRGNLIDESGGYLTQRALRIANALPL